MRISSWKRIPSNWIRMEESSLRKLKAKTDKYGNVGAKISALMLYIAIGLCAEEEEDEAGERALLASPTYDELQCLTGLSRPLISKALDVLRELDLIERMQDGRGVCYRLLGYEYTKGWCKLPCKAMSVRGSAGIKLEPFAHFFKRSRIELHALKMFLYLLAIRDNKLPESHVSFDTISDRTGIPRKDIRKVGSFLLSVGLLSNIKRAGYQETGVSEYEGGANRYYVCGFNDLLTR